MLNCQSFDGTTGTITYDPTHGYSVKWSDCEGAAWWTEYDVATCIDFGSLFVLDDTGALLSFARVKEYLAEEQ